ncbi:hypothetical protein Scep_005290 [Stephania cephalantha]|uniref:Uncharacterized protein n=1 Tax=Stephania cephalantha TaxID=152367 RepID=A0AAP0KU98_9MAGN
MSQKPSINTHINFIGLWITVALTQRLMQLLQFYDKTKRKKLIKITLNWIIFSRFIYKH